MSTCNHCGRDVKAEDEVCANCGIPLPPNHADQRQKTFIRWFIVLVIFCVFMMWWIPPDWSSIGG
jgi:predicted nucleic acid-binding Zn ribbon protein